MVQLIEYPSETFNKLIAEVVAIVESKYISKKDDEEWLTTEETLQFLKTSKGTLQKIRDNKEIEFTPGRMPKYRKGSLKDYLKKRANK